MRTINHKLYIPPTRRDIQNRFRDIGFNQPYSYDFVKDIANAYSHVMHGNSVEQSFIESDNKYTKGVHNLLRNVDFDSLTGISPLEKAASLICMLSKIDSTGESGDPDGDSIPIFDNKSDDTISEEMEKCKEDVKGCRDVGEIAKEMYGMHVPEAAKTYKINEFKDFLNKLALLDSKSFLQTKRVSKKVFSKRMSEYSQISNLTNFSAVGMPTYKYKLATKQLNVRQRKQANKQSLFLLIDDSGSMSDHEKREMLRALLCNRLQAVYDGKAILYIGLFESRLYNKIHVIDSKDKAKEFSTWFPELNGGVRIYKEL